MRERISAIAKDVGCLCGLRLCASRLCSSSGGCIGDWGDREGERGNVLFFLFIAVALVALLSSVIVQRNPESTTTQNAFNARSELEASMNSLLGGIQACVLIFPRGDTATPLVAGFTSAEGEGNNDNRPYPLEPDDNEFDSIAGVSAEANGVDTASLIRCPGNGHQLIFGGTSGRYLKPQPDSFGAWQYFNNCSGDETAGDPQGVFVEITATSSGPSTDKVISQMIDQLGVQGESCGADCLRVWIVNPGTTC